MKRKSLYFAAATAISVAISGMSFAAEQRAAPATDSLPYSDRDQMKVWGSEKNVLEKALKVGQSKDSYRKQLDQLGYRITAVNYDKPDYLEYEVVKGTHSFELQIDMDQKTNLSKKIDVTTNAWKADATERAMKDPNYRAEYPKTTTENAARYSDRERSATYRTDKERLEKAMRLGEAKAFYKQELEKMGYVVTSINKDKPDYVEYEIVKGGDTYEVQIDFDSKLATAKKVDVTANVWKSDATERALKTGPTAAAGR